MPCSFQGLPRLSIDCFFPKIFAIKSRSRRKTTECIQCLAPDFIYFFLEDNLIFWFVWQIVGASTGWQSLVQFHV